LIPKPAGSGSPTVDGGGGIKSSRWREVKRTMTTYKLANRENKENWIKIERITKIEWRDNNGAKLVFEWGESPRIPLTVETKLKEKNLYE
jgi:hypothetical protein